MGSSRCERTSSLSEQGSTVFIWRHQRSRSQQTGPIYDIVTIVTSDRGDFCSPNLDDTEKLEENQVAEGNATRIYEKNYVLLIPKQHLSQD